MVLTGEDDGDMSYMRLQERTLAQGALPPPRSHGNADVVPYRGGGGGFDGDRGRRGGGGYSESRDEQRRYDHRGDVDNDDGYDYDVRRPGNDVRNVQPQRRGGYGGRYDEDAAVRGRSGDGSRPLAGYRGEEFDDGNDRVPYDDRVVPSSRRYNDASYESAGGRATKDAGPGYYGNPGNGGTRGGQPSRR
jgi:hypothetical protein